MEEQTKTLTFTAAKAKAMHYCAYQERSQQEVRDKLYAWGLHREEVENLLTELILENFLNEERFAIAYAGGKHRVNKWGRHKIKQGLKLKAVSDPLIRTALNSLDETEYQQNLQELLDKKAASLRETHPYKRRQKLVNYVLSKGYESDLIFETLNDKDLQ